MKRCGKELPRYSFKQTIQALRIIEISTHDNGEVWICFEGGYFPIIKDALFIQRGNIRVGGYVVFGECGDWNYYSKECFEDRYKPVIL